MVTYPDREPLPILLNVCTPKVAFPEPLTFDTRSQETAPEDTAAVQDVLDVIATLIVVAVLGNAR